MILTEDKIKAMYREEQFTEFYLEEGTRLTPSAREFLVDKGIEIKIGSKKLISKDVEKVVEEPKAKYIGLYGEKYLEKPEYMTQLYGNILVNKSNSRIIFRGKIDSFLGKWLVLEKELIENKNSKLNSDLESITSFIKKIQIAEILNKELKEITVLGDSLERIKEISHNPKKYFNQNHMFDISIKNSYVVLKLNEMRGLSRELELAGVEALLNENKLDILTALNRLSSAIYVMMLKGESGEYGTK